jgi:hypothetical protein
MLDTSTEFEKTLSKSSSDSSAPSTSKFADLYDESSLRKTFISRNKNKKSNQIDTVKAINKYTSLTAKNLEISILNQLRTEIMRQKEKKERVKRRGAVRERTKKAVRDSLLLKQKEKKNKVKNSKKPDLSDVDSYATCEEKNKKIKKNQDDKDFIPSESINNRSAKKRSFGDSLTESDLNKRANDKTLKKIKSKQTPKEDLILVNDKRVCYECNRDFFKQKEQNQIEWIACEYCPRWFCENCENLNSENQCTYC